jgi:hypothetical protein
MGHCDDLDALRFRIAHLDHGRDGDSIHSSVGADPAERISMALPSRLA